MDEQQIGQKNQPHSELPDNKNIPVNQKHFKWKRFFIPLFIANAVPALLILLTVSIKFLPAGFFLAFFLIYIGSLYFVPLAIINIVSIIFYLYRQKSKTAGIVVLTLVWLFLSALVLSYYYSILIFLFSTITGAIGVLAIVLSVIYLLSIII